jgi:hypothetical protein
LVNVTLDTFGLDDSLITWSGVELSQSEKRSGRTNEKMIIAKILPLKEESLSAHLLADERGAQLEYDIADHLFAHPFADTWNDLQAQLSGMAGYRWHAHRGARRSAPSDMVTEVGEQPHKGPELDSRHS